MAKKAAIFGGGNSSGAELVSASSAEITFNYDYNKIDANLRDGVMASVRRMKLQGAEINQRFAKLGQEIAALKNVLEHGQFLDVLELEFSISARQAQKMMKVARDFADEPKLLETFSGSSLSILAASTTPEKVKVEAKEAAEQGVAWTKAETIAKVEEERQPEIVVVDRELDKEIIDSVLADFASDGVVIEQDLQDAQSAGFKVETEPSIEIVPSHKHGEIVASVEGNDVMYSVILEAADGTLIDVSLRINENYVVTLAGQKFAED